MSATVALPHCAEAPDRCDLAVVGAGIVGLAATRELLRRRPGLRVVVLERETEVAAHQSSHNSGVIHAGIAYAPGSLKARLAVEGARELYAFCEQRELPVQRCGKLILATEPRQLPLLDELERRGHANGVPGLRRIGPAEIAEHEPHARGIAALYSPATGITDFGAVGRALAAEAAELGATIVTGCEVRPVHAGSGGARGRSGARVPPAAAGPASDGGVVLEHPGGQLRARHALFCAGAWSDTLASGAGAAGPQVRILPFRGAYRTLAPARAELVRALIYPVPDPSLPFLGVHLTRGIDGEVHVGPTALMVGARDAYRLTRIVPRDLAATLRWPGTWRMAARWWRTGLDELLRAVSVRTLAADARRMVPAIEPRDLLPGPAGVRAQAVARDGRLVDDFLIAAGPASLHVRNAPSPAATASLALGRLIADRCEDAFGLEPVAA